MRNGNVLRWPTGARVCAVAGLFILIGLDSAAGADAAAPAQQMSSAFAQLRAEINVSPSRGVRTRVPVAVARQRQRLTRLVTTASAQAGAGNLCRAVRTLDTVRSRVATPRPGVLTTVGRQLSPGIQAEALQAQSALLTRPATRSCGGGAARPTQGEARITTLSQNANGITLRVTFPQAQYTTVPGGGRSFPQLAMSSLTTAGGDIGKPAVPRLSRLVAVPRGARLRVSTARISSYRLEDVRLLPLQRSAPGAAVSDVPGTRDPIFAPPRFTIDATAYRAAAYPAARTRVAKIEQGPDLRLASIDLNAVRTAPRQGGLEVLTRADLRITFVGGDESYGTTDLISQWNTLSELYPATVANYSTVLNHLTLAPPKPLCGSELLIVTAPDLRAAADKLAAARIEDGVIAKVIETGSGPAEAGVTADQIATTTKAAGSANCAIRPANVLLLGDTNKVPTFRPTGAYDPNEQQADRGRVYYDDIPTDFPYTPTFALLFPVSGVGRIPATTPEDADAAVTKIIAYEQTPPTVASFYERATVASYFQSPLKDELDAKGKPVKDAKGTVQRVPDFAATKDSFPFTYAAERARTALVAGGATVDRRYTVDDATVKPQTDVMGNPLPTKPGFAWNASPATVAGAWNAGRFAIFHFDHGGIGGWSQPRFERTSLFGRLTAGGLTPVVFSFNCLSGSFDDPTDRSFDVSHLLMPNRGSVGGVAPSRITWVDWYDTLAQGILGGLYARPGSRVNTAGMLTLLARINVSTQIGSDQMSLDTIRAFNYFGDPSMQLWAYGTPKRFQAAQFAFSRTGSDVVVATQSADAVGARVTVLDGAGQPLARKVISAKGTTKLAVEGIAVPDGSRAILSARGYVSEQVPIP